MKVIFKNNVAAYVGKADGLVFYYSRKFGRVLARSLPKYVERPQNERLALVAKQIKSLNLSADFIEDLKSYVILYNGTAEFYDTRMACWYNALLRGWYKFANENNVDLTQITRAEIDDNFYPIRSVQLMVTNDLLPHVSVSCDLLTHLY